MAQTYLDFVIEIGAGDGLIYPVAVRLCSLHLFFRFE